MSSEVTQMWTMVDSSIHDIENMVNFLPKFIQIYTRKTRFSKISQIFGQKNDQICREKVTNVNKERWVGKEIQTADIKIMHSLVNLPNHFWTRAKVTSAWGVSMGT